MDGKRGRWVTVNGTAVFIPDGKNQKDVIAEKLKEWERKDDGKKDRGDDAPKKPEKDGDKKSVDIDIDYDLDADYYKEEIDRIRKVLSDMPSGYVEGASVRVKSTPEHMGVPGSVRGSYRPSGAVLSLYPENLTLKYGNILPGVVYHEVAHHVWVTQYSKEQKAEWAKEVHETLSNMGRSVTGYAKRFAEKLENTKGYADSQLREVKMYRKKISDAKKSGAPKKELDDLRSALDIAVSGSIDFQLDWQKAYDLYANEVHSEMFSLVHGKFRPTTEDKIYEALRPAFKRIFGDKYLPGSLRAALRRLAAALDRYAGKPGKWVTIRGHRIFLEEGREDESLKKWVEQFRSEKDRADESGGEPDYSKKPKARPSYPRPRPEPATDHAAETHHPATVRHIEEAWEEVPDHLAAGLDDFRIESVEGHRIKRPNGKYDFNLNEISLYPGQMNDGDDRWEEEGRGGGRRRHHRDAVPRDRPLCLDQKVRRVPAQRVVRRGRDDHEGGSRKP